MIISLHILCRLPDGSEMWEMSENVDVRHSQQPSHLPASTEKHIYYFDSLGE